MNVPPDDQHGIPEAIEQLAARIRQLEATVRAGSSDVPQPSAMEDNEVITRLRELCRRTAWGEALPAATCERLGVMQQPPERGDN